MLTRYGFNGKEAPVVMGSSKLFIDEPENPSEFGKAAIAKYGWSVILSLLQNSTSAAERSLQVPKCLWDQGHM